MRRNYAVTIAGRRYRVSAEDWPEALLIALFRGQNLRWLSTRKPVTIRIRETSTPTPLWRPGFCDICGESHDRDRPKTHERLLRAMEVKA